MNEQINNYLRYVHKNYNIKTNLRKNLNKQIN